MKFHRIKGQQNHHLCRPYGADGELRSVIWVRFFRTGRGRLEESLKTENLAEARELRDRRIAEFLGEQPRGRQQVFLVKDKFPEFLELKRSKAPNTYASMEIQWRLHLEPGLGHLLIDEITETAWLRYVRAKREVLPDRKFFNDRKYLSMFLNWLHRAGLIAKLPRLEDVDPEIEVGRVYADDELKLFLDCSSGDLKLQIQMALTMGMRHGEIWSLEWIQVDWIKRTIHLPAAKTKIRRARTFGLSDVVASALELRLAAVPGSPWVFPSPNDPLACHGKYGTKGAWERLRDETGIEGRMHDFRHTFLTRAFKKAVNPALICEYAGLSLEEATRTYLHFTPDDTKVVASLIELPS